MSNSAVEIKKALSKNADLTKVLNYFDEEVPIKYTTSYGANFSSTDEGKSISVSMPAIDQIATSCARRVWDGKGWKFEYVFYVEWNEKHVEVFRFYLNDEAQVESIDEELFGSVDGNDFLSYVCSGVFWGTLNSPIFSVTPSP